MSKSRIEASGWIIVTGVLWAVGAGCGSGGSAINENRTVGSGGHVSGTMVNGGAPVGGGSTAGHLPDAGWAGTAGSRGAAGSLVSGGISAGGATDLRGSSVDARASDAATGGAMGTGGMNSLPSSTGTATGTKAGTTTCPAMTLAACAIGPTVRISEIDVGAAVVVNEDDAALKPLSISPIPSGGSRLAWMGNDSQVHVATLDCNDSLVGSFGLPAMDYGDIYADERGGVLLVARDAQGEGTLNCGSPTNLCGAPPSPAIPCYDEYLVRFDGSTETWATKLTTASAALPPYSTGPKGPQTFFIWWYAHHGRLAFDGTNWAGYYGAATSISQMCTTGLNQAINIHQGDEMRVISPTGALLSGHNSFDWGCSHSGFEKIVWDPGAGRFVMICRSDAYPHVGLNVNAANLVYAIDAANSAVSDLVLAAGGGYWVLVSNVGALHMFRFTTAASTTDISLGSGNKPHLVSYGSHLLAAWTPVSGTNMVGQVLDASSGAAIGSAFPIAVPSNQFQDFRAYSDGSAAYVAPGSAATKLKIVRVVGCQ